MPKLEEKYIGKKQAQISIKYIQWVLSCSYQFHDIVRVDWTFQALRKKMSTSTSQLCLLSFRNKIWLALIQVFIVFNPAHNLWVHRTVHFASQSKAQNGNQIFESIHSRCVPCNVKWSVCFVLDERFLETCLNPPRASYLMCIIHRF